MTTNNSYIGSPDNPRATAVFSYVTFIGWLVAIIFLLPGQRTRFSAFHLRQSLLIHIFSFLLKVAYSATLNSSTMVFALIAAVAVLLFILWFMGFLAALNGEEKEVPIIGRFAQSLFRNWWMW